MTDDQNPSGADIAAQRQAKLEEKAESGDRMAIRELNYQKFRKVAEDRLLKPRDATTGEEK